jgi:hypothetical protein
MVMTWRDQGRLKVLSGKFGALAIEGRNLKTEWSGTVRVKPLDITDENRSRVGRDGFERSKIRKF